MKNRLGKNAIISKRIIILLKMSLFGENRCPSTIIAKNANLCYY